MSTESMISLDNVHGLPGHFPWTGWKVWTMSMDTLDKVQGAHSDILHCLQADWTMSAESMGSLDIVHGQSPLLALNKLVKKNLSWGFIISLEIHNHVLILVNSSFF